MDNVPEKEDQSPGPIGPHAHMPRMGSPRRVLSAVCGLGMAFIAVDNAIDAVAAVEPVGWWFWLRKVGLPGLLAPMFIVMALRGR